MAGHPLDRAFATDTAQQVLELRARRGELGVQVLDSANRRLYPLVQGAGGGQFIADPDAFQPEHDHRHEGHRG